MNESNLSFAGWLACAVMGASAIRSAEGKTNAKRERLRNEPRKGNGVNEWNDKRQLVKENL